MYRENGLGENHKSDMDKKKETVVRQLKGI